MKLIRKYKLGQYFAKYTAPRYLTYSTLTNLESNILRNNFGTVDFHKRYTQKPKNTGPFSLRRLGHLNLPDIEYTPRALRVVDYARQQIGKPYYWGSKGPDMFDCSGLIYYAYKQNGYDIGSSTELQLLDGTEVTSLDDVKIGDIIITASSRSGSGRHALLVSDVKDGNIYSIEAPGTGKSVQEVIIKPKKENIISIRRIINE